MKCQILFWKQPAILLLALLGPLMVLRTVAQGVTLNKQNIQAALDEAYNKFKDVKEGKNADYIKELAMVDPNIFGIAVVMTDGTLITEGDIKTKVAIESVSKVFTMAKCIEEQGADAVMSKIGVDATGLPFNSVTAIEMHQGKEINPLVNPGAIAASGLIGGTDSVAKWRNILQNASDFAGRQLDVNWPVYVSEASDNRHNEAIAVLLQSYGRMYFDPSQTNDIYTKQCSINVSVVDLATMAATLANGGINPITKKIVVSPLTVMHTLPVMATAGLYDNSGIWFYNVGLPAKSGVGGGLLAVCPGKFGIAVISPPLDAAGNSVKAQLVIQYVVDKLKVNPYLVQPR